MFTELFHQFIVPLEIAGEVERDVLFAWRKRDHHPIHLTAVGIFIATATEAYYARSPHLRFCLGGLLHHLCDRPTILSNLIVFDRIEVVINGSISAFSL